MKPATPTYRIITQPDASFAVVRLADGEMPTLRPGFVDEKAAQAWIADLQEKKSA